MLLFRGQSAAGGVERIGVDLAGAKNGSNVTYTAPEAFDPGTFRLYVNGVRLRPGASDDFTIATPTSIMLSWALLPGDQIIADYRLAP